MKQKKQVPQIKTWTRIDKIIKFIQENIDYDVNEEVIRELKILKIKLSQEFISKEYLKKICSELEKKGLDTKELRRRIVR